MNTQLATATDRHEHPPQLLRTRRRVGPLDRAALHLGLALIKWGRRPVTADAREQAARYAETHEARLERDRLLAESQAQSLNLFR